MDDGFLLLLYLLEHPKLLDKVCKNCHKAKVPKSKKPEYFNGVIVIRKQKTINGRNRWVKMAGNRIIAVSEDRKWVSYGKS